MNKAFTNTKELVLDEKFKIIPDSDNGVILVFTEIRAREKEIKGLKGKKVKTGDIEYFKFEEKYCYPRIAQALRKYSDLTLNENNNFDSLIQKLNDLYLTIDSIDETFKQF